MRADSCSGPTTDSICGHGLGRMGHSSNFARWPHLGPIPPMDGGGHLVPLSYVYGYRGGIGRRSSVEMTPATKLGHQSGDMSSLYGAAWPFLCPNRPFPRWADVGQRKNGQSVEKSSAASWQPHAQWPLGPDPGGPGGRYPGRICPLGPLRSIPPQPKSP